MRVFFACTGKKEPVYLPEAGFKDILCSFHYYKKDFETIAKIKDAGCTLFIDSGAFSAKHAGAEINIDEYSEYLLKVDPEIAVSLDVINNAEATLKNWEYMKEKGTRAMPTFHTKEPMEFLHHYVDNCDYIALGGMVGDFDVLQWLDDVWTYIINNKPTLKVHGFGMTTTDTIYKYPWYSFDSSSFKAGKRFGRIPQFNGKKLYNISMKKFQMRLQFEKGTEDIFENNQKCQQLSDIEGAKAYKELVEYLASFDRKFDFVNQLKLF
jgi:hypothetical protein